MSLKSRLTKPWSLLEGFPDSARLNTLIQEKNVLIMAANYLKTKELATEIGVHPNTIRKFEQEGFLPEIPRDPVNGYRMFSKFHLEQARLAWMALHWAYLVDCKPSLDKLVRYSVNYDFEQALELAYDYLAQIRIERTYAEAAIDYLERWAAGLIQQTTTGTMSISEVADYLNVTVDMLRNWERNGLIAVPRNPDNAYRLYGIYEIGRLRVIRILIQSGHSVMAILRMLQQFDAGHRENLADTLNLPPETVPANTLKSWRIDGCKAYLTSKIAQKIPFSKFISSSKCTISAIPEPYTITPPP
mgnify:CR=1 FL=1